LVEAVRTSGDGALERNGREREGSEQDGGGESLEHENLHSVWGCAFYVAANRSV
jgi:hypothetical protein